MFFYVKKGITFKGLVVEATYNKKVGINSEGNMAKN